LSETDAEFQIKDAFCGVELVADTHRLALMNLMLHDMESDLIQGSSLSDTGSDLEKADLIITNPPFGTARGGGGATRSDLTFETGNKQLSFLQHIYRGLKPGGRAGVVLPDNVLFEEGVGAKIREDLMNKCNLHTILRLPTGIFYAQGVKTNVLFFSRGKTEVKNTKNVWVYDLRTNMPSFGKTSPLNLSHFTEFEKSYGKDPLGKSKRKESERFKKFGIAEIKDKRNFNLDIRWIKDESAGLHDNLPDPEELIIEAKMELEAVLEGLNSMLDELPTDQVQ
jgi:type I restriction enzyme M protein